MSKKRFRINRIDENGDIIEKHSHKKFLVVNVNEPYAEKVFELIKQHEKSKQTWDESDNFLDFVRNIR